MRLSSRRFIQELIAAGPVLSEVEGMPLLRWNFDSTEHTSFDT